MSDECTHADGCGCGDDWNQTRREAYQNGKDVGKATATRAIVAFLRRDNSPNYNVDREHMARCIERGEHLK